MDGVRTVASIFFVLGCVMLLLGVVAALAILVSIGSTSGGLAGAMIQLAIAFGVSMSPFFLWAVLRSLIEIYELQLRSDETLRRVLNAEQLSLATLQQSTGVHDAGVEAPAPRLQRAVGVASSAAPPELGSVSLECPNCGHANAGWRSVCETCGSTLA